jgi:CDP-paratose 2-epimerase
VKKDFFLVTGSCGLIGFEISNFLLNRGYKVIGIDNNYRKFFFGKNASVEWTRKLLIKNKNYKHYNIDIRNKKKLEYIFKKYRKFNSIIHCAAQPSHDWAKNDPVIDFDVNARATLLLLNLTNKYTKKSSFVYLSTNKVYGDKVNSFKFKELRSRYELKSSYSYSKKGISENMNIDQSKHSLFGASKLSADIIVQEYGRYNNLNTVCFRCGCLTGPMHSGAELHGFLSYLLKSYVENKTYNVFGYKGKQVRDNLHSKDLINIIWEYIKKPKRNAVYNIGGGRLSNCSVLEAIKLCEKIGKKKFKYKIIKKPRIGDHIWWISDLSKFKKDYPTWKQRYNIKMIINEMYEFLIK